MYPTYPFPQTCATESEALESDVRRLINDGLEFISDHRFDPVEVYGEDFAEYFKAISSPTVEPNKILNELLFVLDNYGKSFLIFFLCEYSPI